MISIPNVSKRLLSTPIPFYQLNLTQIIPPLEKKILLTNERKLLDHTLLISIPTYESIHWWLCVGAEFVIPHFKTENAFHIGKGYSIFTAELCAILMVLSYFVDLPCMFLSILFCVDSKATLLALNDDDNKFRSDIIFHIKYMIDCLLAKL